MAFSSGAASPTFSVGSAFLGGGGNVVLVASDRPLDLPALQERLAALGEPAMVLGEGATRALAGAAAPLTDDHAPADQLITPYRYT